MNIEFFNMVVKMSEMDINKSPNYICSLALATNPVAMYPNQEEIAFTMTVDVTDDFVNDPQFEDVIENFITTLNNIYIQLKKDFPDKAPELFKTMASSMSLKYNY